MFAGSYYIYYCINKNYQASKDDQLTPQLITSLTIRFKSLKTINKQKLKF